MSYTPPSISATGVTIPRYQQIMGYLTAQAQAIFGSDIYLGSDSADYQMMSTTRTRASSRTRTSTSRVR